MVLKIDIRGTITENAKALLKLRNRASAILCPRLETLGGNGYRVENHIEGGHTTWGGVEGSMQKKKKKKHVFGPGEVSKADR